MQRKKDQLDLKICTDSYKNFENRNQLIAFQKGQHFKVFVTHPTALWFKISLPKLNSLSTAALDGRVVLYWMKSFFNPSSSKEFASMDFGGSAYRKIYQLKVDRFFLKLTQKLKVDPENS